MSGVRLLAGDTEETGTGYQENSERGMPRPYKAGWPLNGGGQRRTSRSAVPGQHQPDDEGHAPSELDQFERGVEAMESPEAGGIGRRRADGREIHGAAHAGNFGSEEEVHDQSDEEHHTREAECDFVSVSGGVERADEQEAEDDLHIFPSVEIPAIELRGLKAQEGAGGVMA